MLDVYHFTIRQNLTIRSFDLFLFPFLTSSIFPTRDLEVVCALQIPHTLAIYPHNKPAGFSDNRKDKDDSNSESIAAVLYRELIAELLPCYSVRI